MSEFKRKLHIDELAKAISPFTKFEILTKVETDFFGIGTDTRKDLTGQLFLALKGESFDGHDFLENAVKAGAAGIIVHSKSAAVEKLKGKISIFHVGDTLTSLQALGRFCRLQNKAKIVGITGSNGKTTSKEFTAALLKNFFRVHASEGSFNNHWGVPFTLIQTPPDTEVAIIEMGMNHEGELTQLVNIAYPDLVVCTTVGMAHAGHFSSLDAIARAKEEIYLASPVSAIRIFNLDNPHTQTMYLRGQNKERQLTFTVGTDHPEANVILSLISSDLTTLNFSGKLRPPGSVRQESLPEIQVPVFGIQNLTNLAVAAAIGLSLDLTPSQIWTGLTSCRTTWGRNQLLRTKRNAQILFDGYNANPDSMSALIKNIKNLRAKPPVESQPIGKEPLEKPNRVSITKPSSLIGVFGEMLELGDDAPAYHEALGQQVGSVDFDTVFFIGPSAPFFEKGLKSSGFKKSLTITNSYKESLAKEFASMLKANDMAVIKGSRGMKLEKFLSFCELQDPNQILKKDKN